MKNLFTFSVLSSLIFFLCTGTYIQAQHNIPFDTLRLGPPGSNQMLFIIDEDSLPPITTPTGMGTPGYKFYWNFDDGSYQIFHYDVGDVIKPVYHVYPANDPTDPMARYKPKVKVTLKYTADKDPLAEGTKRLGRVTHETIPPFPINIDMGDSLVRIEAVREPVPGEEVTYIVSYTDTIFGPNATGVVSYEWDENMAFKDITFYNKEDLITSIEEDSVGPGFIAWAYSGLAPGEVRNVFLTFETVGLSPGVGVGTQVGDTVKMVSKIGQTTRTEKDTAEYYFKVYPSHDPNAKVVTPQIFNKNQETLTYTIHFQNEGMGPAKFIEITDEIDKKLDFDSFKMEYVRVGQGEAKNIDLFPSYFGFKYKIDRDPSSRTIKWFFDPVYLPGTKDPEGYYGDIMTSGEIVYSIKTECIEELGTRIPNTAEIIFDANAPIETDTVFATKACCMERVWDNGGKFDLRRYVKGLEGEVDKYSINIIDVASKDAEPRYQPDIVYVDIPYLEYYPGKFHGMDVITYKACDFNGNCGVFQLTICVNMDERAYPCLDEDCNNNEVIDISDSPWVRTYPNPFKNYLKLSYRDKLSRIRKLEIVNMYGEVVKNIPVSRNGKSIVDTRLIPPGYYFLRINEMYVQKLVK